MKATFIILSLLLLFLTITITQIKAEDINNDNNNNNNGNNENNESNESNNNNNPPMVNADDLAKEELLLLGSLPQLLPNFKARDIFAGGYQSALISDKGEFYYWGLVANAGVEAPKKVEFFNPDNEKIEGSLPSFSSLSLGGYHIIAVDESGKLYTMGRGEGGVLGHGDVLDLPAPKLLESMKKRHTRIAAAGYSHSVAVTDTGLFAWGLGERGQLGSGTSKNFYEPKLVKVAGVSAKRISDICTGGYHTALLTDEGEVYTFGGNSFGALGHGHSQDSLSPSRVMALLDHPVKAISCGGDHTLALTRKGEIFAWGWGEKGQLGSGRSENIFTPYKVDFEDELDEDDEITSITAGGYATSFVVTKKGRVYGFGWGEFGILGNGGNDNLLKPTLISGLSNVSKIATGYKHALALTKQGDVYVFGEDTYGSLGLGEQSSSSSSSSSNNNNNNVISSPSTNEESILPSNFESISSSPSSNNH